MIIENCFEINRYVLDVTVNDKHLTSIVSDDIDRINSDYERIFNELHTNNNGEVKDVVRITVFDYDKNTIIREYGTDEV